MGREIGVGGMVLATFVIGLREGLEASLIVGIIAAFLTRNGDRKSIRSMWIGVGAAIIVCIGVGAGLELAGRRLPFKQREILEGVLTVIAVAGVTYMIVWMRRHSRTLRSDLEAKAWVALGSRSGTALVVMAFLAVVREGLETVIFLTASLKQATSAAAGAVGAVAGVVVAIGIGYAMYRGGVKVNLRKFFGVTGLLLVLVAAGLVSTALHEFTEAGLIGFGTTPAVDLAWLVRPGTIRAALVTGFLGIQPVPTVLESLAWLAFLIPMGWYVATSMRTRPLAS
ncbi:MAG: FTR1 family protein [Acidimicrobiia bacterium]|nr:FTR1 family protein [Acidimicrobiia bacterium]MDH4306620.1 FTR1 family protein [Acidimicrobiia bacterium]MDH5292070.1 FTR1 family protein [Acidimicrobiia bacterium]